MKQPIAVGIVIAVVILGGALSAPALRSSAGKNRAQALEQAELARRRLAYAATRVANAAVAIELSALKSVEFRSLIEASPDSFAALEAEFRDAVDKANATDRKNAARGVKSSPLQPIDIAGAIGSFENRLAEDVKLLAAAEQAAKSADSQGNVLAVKQVVGMVEYLKASLALAESQRYRKQLVAQRDATLKIGAALMLAQSRVDEFRGLDVTEIVADLQTSLDEASAAESEAKTEADSLEALVAERRRELDDVSGKLTAVRVELLTHEQSGFTAGDDRSFEPYAERHRTLNEALRRHQREEQTLRFGGLKDASFDSDDFLKAAITGGEPVTALSELEWRLQDARSQADGYRIARESAEQTIKDMRAVGETAGGNQADYESRIEKLREELKTLRQSVKQVITNAVEKENEALRAGRRARDAFKAAAAAATAWVRDAQTLRDELDLDRPNERLDDIRNDGFVTRIGPSSQGAALLLIARVDAQRILDFERELEARNQFSEFVPGFDFGSTQTMNEMISTARDDGTTSLKDAITIYEDLARGAGATAWVPRTALAAAHYLMSKIDPANADQHLASALATMDEAVAGQEHSPYLLQYVRFRNHLRVIVDRDAVPDVDPGDFGEDD